MSLRGIGLDKEMKQLVLILFRRFICCYWKQELTYQKPNEGSMKSESLLGVIAGVEGLEIECNVLRWILINQAHCRSGKGQASHSAMI